MNLRPATMDDAQRLFDWRNDPVTRAMFRNTAEVPWADHVAWLERTLADPTRILLLAEHDGTPVGTMRIDYGDEPELSWTVAPEYRNCGFGSEMVRMGTPDNAVAWIKPENIASQRIAEKAGFAFVSDGPLQKWVREVRAVAAR